MDLNGNCLPEEKKDRYELNFNNPTELSPFPQDDEKIYIGSCETHYNMDNPYRGYALIFNHEHFPTHTTRRGTDIDCKRIKQILEAIGFIVIVYDDLTYNEIMKMIKTAASEDHSEHDCIVVVIMSHGSSGTISASDVWYKPERLYECFTDDKCPSLADKPKLFFIQACRGDKGDAGITLIANSNPNQPESETETDAVIAEESDFKMYTEPDFLIFYSTAPGYYSFRRAETGSWFIQELCQGLNNIYDLNILHIMTNVTRCVAHNYNSYIPDKPDCRKQIPCIASTLTRILQFTRKD